MHGYKWPINCTRTRTAGPGAASGSGWRRGGSAERAEGMTEQPAKLGTAIALGGYFADDLVHPSETYGLFPYHPYFRNHA